MVARNRAFASTAYWYCRTPQNTFGFQNQAALKKEKRRQKERKKEGEKGSRISLCSPFSQYLLCWEVKRRMQGPFSEEIYSAGVVVDLQGFGNDRQVR